MKLEDAEELRRLNAILSRWAFGSPPQEKKKRKPSKRQALMEAKKAELRKRVFDK